MKTISIFLSFINALLAGLLITFSLTTNELYHAEVWWSLIKMAASLTVIVLGVVTWLSSMNGSNIGLLFMGGIFVIVLGAVMIVWTFHLAIVSGDMEYYMVGYGASLMAQGMASLLGFGEDARKTTV
jgi:lipopolysaccharide export LptBFGC system permease protein LptF